MAKSAAVPQFTVFADIYLEALDRVREGLGVYFLQALVTPSEVCVSSLEAVARQPAVHNRGLTVRLPCGSASRSITVWPRGVAARALANLTAIMTRPETLFAGASTPTRRAVVTPQRAIVTLRSRVQRALRIFSFVVIRDGSVVAVVLAGGSGTRVGADGNKAYIPLAGRSLASWSLNAFGRLPPVGRRILVIRPEDREVAEEVIDRELDDSSVEVIEGGSTRHSSEWAALTYLREDIDRGKVDLVLIHDAARPLMTRTLVQAVIKTAAVSGGAIPGIFDDELGLVDDYGDLQPALAPGTGHLVRTQTPQGFLAKPLLSAYELAKADGFEGTDTASTMLRYSDVKIRPVPGDTRNFKITYPQDLFTAEDILSAAQYNLT